MTSRAAAAADLARMLLALVVLVMAVVWSPISSLAEFIFDHLMRTVLYLLPSQSRARRIVGRWVSYYSDGRCWKCGATAPSREDITGGD